MVMRAAILAGNAVANIVIVTALSDVPGSIDAAKSSIGDVWDGKTFTAPVVAPDPAVVSATSEQAIQAMLEKMATDHGYDSILSLCSYATSTNTKWKVEGQYGCDYRDACWSKAQTIQSDVLAGKRSLPSVDQVLAEMPAITWPA